MDRTPSDREGDVITNTEAPTQLNEQSRQTQFFYISYVSKTTFNVNYPNVSGQGE